MGCRAVWERLSLASWQEFICIVNPRLWVRWPEAGLLRKAIRTLWRLNRSCERSGGGLT